MKEDIKLIHGDCIVEMKNIPNESVDLIVTDPPYRCISGGKPHKKNQPGGILKKNDGKIFDNNDLEIKDWMPLIYRVLKEGCHAYVMTNLLNLEEMIKEAKKVGFKIHNLLVWQKNNATPSRWYMKNAEFTLFLRKGKAKPINNFGSKMVHQFDNIIGNKSHPTEKPVSLMQLYVENSSDEGYVVLDPFMGTCSTGIACVKTNRKFIGIELDDKYYDIACNRINEAKSQLKFDINKF